MNWVETSNKLPRHGQRVLTYGIYSSREQVMTYNSQSKRFTNAGGNQFGPDLITHWAEITPPVNSGKRAIMMPTH